MFQFTKSFSTLAGVHPVAGTDEDGADDDNGEYAAGRLTMEAFHRLLAHCDQSSAEAYKEKRQNEHRTSAGWYFQLSC